MSDNGGYEQHLPALYQGDSFWARFLKPFERIFSTGATLAGGVTVQGFEQVIDQMHERFVPDLAPRNFLGWLAAWLALTLREDWDEPTQRTLIRRISSLYPQRGTPAGILSMLELYLPTTPPAPTVSIVEASALQVGVTSTVGVDTWVGGDLPHHFTVRVEFPRTNLATFELRRRAVIDIVEREKPAHTFYDLEMLIPTMQVGVHSTVGVDTVLGNELV